MAEVSESRIVSVGSRSRPSGESTVRVAPLRVMRWGDDPVEFTGHVLRRFAELAMLSTVLAVPLLYHLALSVPLATRLQEFVLGVGISAQTYQDQIAPMFVGQLPVLETKFTAWFVLGAVMVVAYLALQFLQALTGRHGLGLGEHAGDGEAGPRSVYRRVPLFVIGAFIVLGVVSILMWPPPAPPEAKVFGEGGEGTRTLLSGGAGFFHSMIAWLQVCFGLIFFLVAEDLMRRRLLVAKMLGLLVVAGVLNAGVVLLQKVQWEPFMQVWYRFPESESRNNLGAFIGHNTGMSSFLMAPLLITVIWVTTIQPRKIQWLRVISSLAMLLMVLALVLAQSRAVIPIVTVCGLTMLGVLWRRACLMKKSRFYFVLPTLVAFAVLTQFVPSKLNPLYRKDVTMAKRLTEFTPERLLTETRLRILAVSMTQLVPVSPLLGHSFGSFQYVYPRAQGRYFQEHPQSVLAPTPFRTMRAHNEYLQVLVEMGAVGLVLVLVGLFYLLRGGWLVMGRTLMPHHIATQAGIFFSIMALLIHCAFDFPLRVPPICLTLVLLLAAWSAGDRVWLFRTKEPRPEEELTAENGVVANVRTPLGFMRPGLQSAVGVTLLVVGLYAMAAGTSRTVNRYLSARLLAGRADTLASSNLIWPAWDSIYFAKRLFWIAGDVNNTHARVQYLIAEATFREADARARNGDMEAAANARALAVTRARAALSDLAIAFNEERVHFMYRLQFLIFRLLSNNSLDAEREVYYQASVESLYRAVDINPGDPETVFHLAQLLERDHELNRSEILRLFRLLHHFHHEFFDRVVFGQALEAIALSEYVPAHRRLGLVVDAVPAEVKYRLVSAQLNIEMGNLEQAIKVLSGPLDRDVTSSELSSLYRETHTILRFQLALRQGDIAAGERWLSLAGRFRHAAPIQVLTLRYMLARQRDPVAPETTALREELLEKARIDPMVHQIVGIYVFKLQGDIDESIWWLEKRLAAVTPAIDAQGAVMLAKCYMAKGEYDKAEALLPKIEGKGLTPHAIGLANDVARIIRDRIATARAEVESP